MFRCYFIPPQRLRGYHTPGSEDWAWLAQTPEVVELFKFDPFKLTNKKFMRRKGQKWPMSDVYHYDADGFLCVGDDRLAVTRNGVPIPYWDGIYYLPIDRDFEFDFQISVGYHRYGREIITQKSDVKETTSEYRIFDVQTRVKVVYGETEHEANFHYIIKRYRETKECVIIEPDGSESAFSSEIYLDLGSTEVDVDNPEAVDAFLGTDRTSLIQLCQTASIAGLRPTFETVKHEMFAWIVRRLSAGTTNPAEFLVGLVEMPETVRDVARVLGMGGKIPISELAGLFLVWLYAIKPIPEDIAAVKLALKRLKQKMLREGQHLTATYGYAWEGWEGIQRVHLYTSPLHQETSRPLEQIISDTIDSGKPLRAATAATHPVKDNLTEVVLQLESAGIPTDAFSLFGTLIELYPLEFVANWFIGFEDWIDRAHAQELLTKIPILCCGASVKALRQKDEMVKQLVDPVLTCAYSVGLLQRYYFREYRETVPSFPILSEHDTSVVIRSSGQLTALILQRAGGNRTISPPDKSSFKNIEGALRALKKR